MAVSGDYGHRRIKPIRQGDMKGCVVLTRSVKRLGLTFLGLGLSAVLVGCASSGTTATHVPTPKPFPMPNAKRDPAPAPPLVGPEAPPAEAGPVAAAPVAPAPGPHAAFDESLRHLCARRHRASVARHTVHRRRRQSSRLRLQRLHAVCVRAVRRVAPARGRGSGTRPARRSIQKACRMEISCSSRRRPAARRTSAS